MPTTVTCRGCGTNYKAIGPASRCPVCDLCLEAKEDSGKARSKTKPAGTSTKCPICNKTLAPGVKFCAACGASVEAVDAGNEFVAGMKLEEKSQKDIARTRWQMFCARFFPWW